MAQDELQVQEHPCLGSLHLYLEKRRDHLRPLTRDELNASTPVLIEGALRVCAISTSPSSSLPQGLFGNEFAKAPGEAVLSSTTFFPSPAPSDILAIEAPKPGRGSYSWSQMNEILSTAASGFVAAKEVSCRGEGEGKQKIAVTIHTGHWGCGAYGGNKVLMACLQGVAARIAQVGLVYHAFNDEGVKLVKEGLALMDKVCEQAAEGDFTDVGRLITNLVNLHFQWGQSDGN